MNKLGMIMCVLFIPAISSATPSIINVSGNFNHGNNITITGIGFGTKSPAKPLVWADFENLSIGDTSSENPTYSTGSLGASTASQVLVTTADLPHTRSTKSVRALGTNNANINSFSVEGSTHVFAYTKRKWAHADWFMNLTNFKSFRLWSTPGLGLADMIIAYSNYSNPWSYPSGGRTFLTAEGGVVGTRDMPNMSGPPPSNVWNTEEYQVSKSTLDTQDGRFRMWLNGVNVSNTSLKTPTTKYPSPTWSRLYLENFNHYTTQVSGGPKQEQQWPPAGAYVYWDDVYIDSTWSRAMIGNASTYDACTHREPLIPTAWSASSITAYFNQGSFKNGQNVYVFVVDSNGNASPGKAITIGGAAEARSNLNPNAPVKLSIN